MKNTIDVVEKIGEYETAGFSRDQAIQIVQIEQLIILNNRLTSIKECFQKGGD